MKIGVLGGGAVGLFFAANLAQWFPVTLFTRTKEQAAAINKQGITVNENGKETAHFVQARQVDQLIEHSPDCLFIAVKQYELLPVLPVLEKAALNTALVFLQNGMGHLTQLEPLPQPFIFVAAVKHGMLKTGPGRVDVRGRGKTNVAVYRGDPQAIYTITKQTADVFPFEWRPDYESMLLEKMAANTVINPLTAILRITNGELVENPHYLKLAESVFKEFAAVFKDKTNVSAWNEVVNICRSTAANRSSMLRDIEAGRPTEIETIVGYVLSQAAKNKVDVPVLETVYHMIKGLESK
ncbi:2-dehydropantoate 2-reductase [Bacillus aerolatus]|uniref:2-dehydropantoate 2-reductase n=1 Tax=Bacillus aerolatus TaxID=2653354 RepID=A0A6I1FI18_9BACI|nr:2-dehydropantoate 2-reductase [Bacillus aerolatus]KAB7707962.1 2-dehydropantoate 2-reductase [Bacillus aerolatus]